MKELIDSFRKDCELRKFVTAPEYARIAIRYLRWLELRGVEPEKISKADLKEYLLYMREEKQNSFSTLQRTFTGLNCFYSFLEEEGRIAANPIPAFQKRYLSAYKDNGAEQRQLISVDQAARLVGSALDSRGRAILLLLLKTGMRRGELHRLDVSDIDMQRQQLTLKPTAKRSNRLLFFDGEAADVLDTWLDSRSRKRGMDTPALLLSNEGKRLSMSQIERGVARYATIAGLHDSASGRLEDHFGPHCCRHWFTTHLLRAGMQREYVQWLRGDAIREAVDIYYHIDPEDVRRSYLAHIPRLGI
jgi:integrase/recombinase XerD